MPSLTPNETDKNATKNQFKNAKSPIGTFLASDSKGGITPLDNVSNGTNERDNYNDNMKQTHAKGEEAHIQEQQSSCVSTPQKSKHA